MGIWIQVFLILGCGVLAMAEMAIGASRNTHLAMRAEQGKAAAAVVIGFSLNASRLLGTTQLGITALAILSRIYGEALWVPRVQAWLQGLNLPPRLRPEPLPASHRNRRYETREFPHCSEEIYCHFGGVDAF